MNGQATRTMGTTLKNVTDDLMIANLTSIGEIGIESDEIDATDLDSPNDFKEYIGGFKDAGEISIAGNIKQEAIIEAMLALANSRAMKSWTVTYPSGAKWTFNAFVKSFKDGEKTVDGLASFTASLRVSGAPVYTASTGSV